MSTKGFLKEARMRLEEATAQRERLTKELETVRRLEDSLRTILAAYSSPAEGKARAAGRGVTSDVSADVLAQPKEQKPSLSPLVEQIARVLREAGEPVHFKEIAARLLKSGVNVPGLNPPNNVSAHLSRHKDIFERMGARGMWGLKAPADPAEQESRVEQSDATDDEPFFDGFDVTAFTPREEAHYGPEYGSGEDDAYVA